MDHNAPPRLPDNDSFICGQQFGESNHWMEGMNDQDSYVNSLFRILQPFDFAGRTSTLDFSVDAETQGSHSAWIEAWLTADPQQVPHEDFPGTQIFPPAGRQFPPRRRLAPGEAARTVCARSPCTTTIVPREPRLPVFAVFHDTGRPRQSLPVRGQRRTTSRCGRPTRRAPTSVAGRRQRESTVRRAASGTCSTSQTQPTSSTTCKTTTYHWHAVVRRSGAPARRQVSGAGLAHSRPERLGQPRLPDEHPNIHPQRTWTRPAPRRRTSRTTCTGIRRPCRVNVTINGNPTRVRPETGHRVTQVSVAYILLPVASATSMPERTRYRSPTRAAPTSVLRSRTSTSKRAWVNLDEVPLAVSQGDTRRNG